MHILLVEDHKLLSEGLKNTLLGYSDIEQVDTVDETENVDSVLRSIRQNRYDLILLDINIKPLFAIDGLALCRRILQQDPEEKIVILTGYDLYALEKEAKAIGASGFLNKEIRTEELYRKLQKVRDGEKLFKIKEDRLTDLTKKELEIIHLYAQGRSRTEVAEALDISLRTLANHLNTIYGKLEVKNYQEMIRAATLLGYVKENIM